MALIDTSFLLTDPDFVDTVTLIRRASTINDKGRNELTETSSQIIAAVQSVGSGDFLTRLPEGARLADSISVYYQGELFAESPSGYADVIVWGGSRYQVKEISEHFMNHGKGFTKAECLLEAAYV